MNIIVRSVLCSLFLSLFACRQDSAQSDMIPGPAERLQGVYQKNGEDQLARECRTGKLVRLQDAPDDELRQQCSLFDHPENARLWLDLEGFRAADTVFVIQHILRIERRNIEEVCR